MEIFGCLLSLRARADFHLGFIQEGHADHIHFSPYVVCEKKVGPAPTSSSSGASPALASADRGGSCSCPLSANLAYKNKVFLGPPMGKLIWYQ
jgi:hypothetical protein